MSSRSAWRSIHKLNNGNTIKSSRNLNGKQFYVMFAPFGMLESKRLGMPALTGGGAAASSLGSAVSCGVEGRAIDTALGQCFIPNSSH